MAPVPNTPTRTGGRLFRLASSPGAAARERLVDAALGALDEGDQVVHLRVAGQLGAQPLEGLGRVETGAHQDAVGLLQPLDRLRGYALALEADGVEPVAGRL